MPEPVVPAPLAYVEPTVQPAGSPAAEQAPAISVPVTSVPDSTRAAAQRVLDGDGRDFHLQPWQVAYLIATTEGREGVVPLGCGVGKGWLQARMDEAMSADAGD